MAKHDCIIFTGPSLSWSEVASIDKRLRCCAPAVRGDISRAVEAGARLIGLIDGVFYDRAAVSHREIIDAVRSGVTVVGGSSMGALRASELDGFGMIGVGKIYACFKQGRIEADDEVAVAYNPVTFAPVSDPLVNIRFALHSLVETAVVDTGTSDALLGLARSIFYMERSFPSLLSIAEQRALITKQGRIAIDTFLAGHDYDLKKRDAKLVVQAVIKLHDQLR
ncbi:MAG: TfuA-related McrA-glycine thioamidation protein [Halobacteriota archaeon]